MFLLGPALLFRLSGAAVRASAAPLSPQVGWLLCAVGGWLVAGAAGAFAPVGLALLAGLVLSLIDARSPHQPLRSAGDAIVVVLCGLVSIPTLAVAPMAVAALGVVIVGTAIDQAARRFAGPVRVGAAILPLLLWVLFGVVAPQARAELIEEKGAELRPAVGLFFAVTAAERGERVELGTGAVAWLTEPSGPPPYRGALFFHGRHPEASQQRSALFLRRTLVSLGYAVLAVDQPGFGDSPLPRPLEVGSFDPRPSSIAAARYLESLPEVAGSLLLVGHSMGAASVLRLLEEWPGASAGVILGATVMAPQDESVYGHFLLNYDLESEAVSNEFVFDVRSRYLNNDLATSRLPEGHPPVLFIRYAFEYENIQQGRRQLYAMIPGRKVRWQVRTDHQMATGRLGDVLTGDWRVMREMRRGLGAFMEGINPVNGRRMRFTPR